MTETAYDLYLRLREEWFCVVLEGKKADTGHKCRLFDRLARSWSRLTKSERSCAGKHAALYYHKLERSVS